MTANISRPFVPVAQPYGEAPPLDSMPQILTADAFAELPLEAPNQNPFHDIGVQVARLLEEFGQGDVRVSWSAGRVRIRWSRR